MRRRGRRQRPWGSTVGVAAFAGLTFLAGAMSPELREAPGRADVRAVAVATPPLGDAPRFGRSDRAAVAQGAVATSSQPIPLPPAASVAADNTTAAMPGQAPPRQTVEALPGDTPLRLLSRVGVAPQDARAAVQKLASVWDPRDLKAGQKAAVSVQSDRLLSVRLALAPGRDVVVARDDNGRFVAEDQDRPTREVPTLAVGTIHTSLSEAASRAAVPPGVLGEMIRAFSYDVDFQREVRPGDGFMLLYQRVDDEFGRPTGTGRLVYAELVLSGERLRLYRFAPPGGEPGYYNALGENIRKPLLRTPVDAVRITSGFGMRLHPILGFSRMHRGVDFAAPIGTAVYAAGDGVVAEAGRVSGYGNYIEIEHNQGYATAYAHLSAFARGLHDGEQVRQGEVIGYVGMTGMATGPHLHYEVHYKGVQIDPLSVKMPAMTRLGGADLRAFRASRDAIERELLELRQDLVARVACGGSC
jgi:murein DD-endopeptidase MepM/ murein hydrolase activator NlpD